MEQRLPQKTLLLWQIRLILVTLILIGFITYTCLGFGWYLYVVLAIIILSLGLLIWYLPALFKSYKISYVDGAVIIEKGVIVKTTHIMPFSKMIYTQIITTPLAKFLKLSAFTLKAARSRIFIPEFPAEDVEKFAKLLAEGEK